MLFNYHKGYNSTIEFHAFKDAFARAWESASNKSLTDLQLFSFVPVFVHLLQRHFA